MEHSGNLILHLHSVGKIQFYAAEITLLKGLIWVPHIKPHNSFHICCKGYDR